MPLPFITAPGPGTNLWPVTNLAGTSYALTTGGGFSLDAFMAAQADGFYFNTDVTSSTWQDISATVPADDIGEAIGRINDLRAGAGSPHNGLQSTDPRRPALQATGAKFDGLDDNWPTDYTAGAGENFIVSLVTVPATLSGTQFIAGATGASLANAFLLGITSTGKVGVGVGSKLPATQEGTSDIRGQTVVVGMSFDGSTVKVFVDDSEEFFGAQSGTPTTSIPLRVGAFNNNGTAGNFFAGSIDKSVVAQGPGAFLSLSTYLKIRNALLA